MVTCYYPLVSKNFEQYRHVIFGAVYPKQVNP